jgi:hypothetical protein
MKSVRGRQDVSIDTRSLKKSKPTPMGFGFVVVSDT